MKNLLFLISLSTLVSCGAYVRTISGTTESKLIKTVSLEQGCPAENIKVIDKVIGSASGTYSMDVCGKKMVYKLVGNTFMEASTLNKK